MVYCDPGSGVCFDDNGNTLIGYPSNQPQVGADGGSTGGVQTPPTDPTACHDFCDSTYGSTDSAAWSACVAQCKPIPYNSGCSVFNVAACIPNWVPLPNSPATEPPPWQLFAGAGGVILILAILVFAASAGRTEAARATI